VKQKVEKSFFSFGAITEEINYAKNEKDKIDIIFNPPTSLKANSNSENVSKIIRYNVSIIEVVDKLAAF